MPDSKYLAAAVGLLLAGTDAWGCELCAVYTGPIGLGDPAHGWFVGAAEQFTASGGLQLDGSEAPNYADQRLESSITQLILGYSFNERFSLQTSIPFIARSFRRSTALGIENGSESGLGDAILLGKLLLWQKSTEDSTFTGSLLAGIKFPTGSTSRLRQETLALDAAALTSGSTHHLTTTPGTTASAIHGNELTLGSGSLDARIGTSIYYRHKDAFFTAAFQYALCNQGSYGYRFGNDLTWDGGPGYYLLSGPSYTLSLEAAVSGEHKDSDTYKNQPVDATAFTAVYLGPKLNFTWKDRLSAHLGVDFPVSIANNGLQVVPGTRLRAGFTWLLGPGPSTATKAEAKPRAVAIDGSAPPVWTSTEDSRFYAGIEYLNWWVKAAPLAVPLVSTGAIATTHHGLIGTPNSTILYGAPHSPALGGSDTQGFPPFSGTRMTLGYSLGESRRIAIEASGFLLGKQSAGYETRGDSTGNPVLGIPVYNSVLYSIGGLNIVPGEDSLPFSLPDDPARARNNGVITGGINISNSLQFWGTELTGVFSLYRNASWEVSGLLGVRYLDLSEKFDLVSDIQGVSGPYQGQSGVVTDNFDTRNQFCGGTLGARARYHSGPLSFEMSGGLSFGVSHETENISGGYYSYNFTAPYSSGPEGVFAQPANEGRQTGNRFAVVPQFQAKIGYNLTPRLRATIGYDFLYYSSVLRPGDQLNRELPKGQTFDQADPVVSTTSPSRLFKTSSFFAQGLSLGLEYRF